MSDENRADFLKSRTSLPAFLIFVTVLICIAIPDGSARESLEVRTHRLLAEAKRKLQLSLGHTLTRTLDFEPLRNHPETQITYLIKSQIGDSYFDAQDYPSAAHFQEMASKLSDRLYGTNSSQSLSRLSRWLETLYFLDEYQAAVPLAERALALSKALYGENSLETAERESDLALIYSYSDRGTEAVVHAYEALRIRIETQGLLEEETIEQLRIFAEAGRNLPLGPERGAKIDEIALALSAKSLGWNSIRTETILNDIDWFYRQQDDCKKALPYALAALDLTLKLEGTDTSEVANRYHSVGTNYYCIGNLGQAITNTEQALEISKVIFGNQHSRVAYLEAELADWHEQAGHPERSMQMAKSAMEALNKSMGDHHPNAPDVFDFVATAALHWDAMWSKELSLRYLNAVREDWGNDDVALVDPLINLANAEMILGATPQALRHAQQAVDLTLGYAESHHLLPDEDALDALVLAADAAGHAREAEHVAFMALNYSELRSGLNHPYSSHAYQQLASVIRHKYPAIAVALLKRAIRLEFAMLPKANEDNEGNQRTLSDLIIPHCQRLEGWLRMDGRSTEIQRVNDQTECTKPPELTPNELAWFDRYDQISRKKIAMDRPTRRLKREEEHGSVSQRDLLLARNLDARIKKQTATLNALFTQPMIRPVKQDAQPSAALITAIKERLKTEAKGTAWIHFEINDDHLETTVVTENVVESFTVKDGPLLLKQYRTLSSLTPNQCSSLYRLLIQPIRVLLNKEEIRHLLVDATSNVPNIPYAALHDGQHFLAESYSIVQLYGATKNGIPLRSPIRMTAFGSSEALNGFKPLPWVRNELETLERFAGEQNIPYTMQMNARFTEGSVKRAIDSGSEVIHLATHFIPSPGRQSASSLLMGNGQHLTAQSFVSALLKRDSVKLVSLSACETRTPEGDNIEASQQDLMTQLIKAGIPQVLGTLWPVDDEGAFKFMTQFYHHLYRETKSISEAFQATQKDMIKLTEPSVWGAFILMAR